MNIWHLPERFDTGDGLVAWNRLGSGSPVVLLHGSPFSSYVWREVAAALAGRHQVFVWDLLGHGQSEQRDGQDVSLDAQHRILAALLDEWGLRRPAVVGHDFGGSVALRATLLSGRTYRRLALLDAAAVGPWGSPFLRLARENPAVFRALPGHLHEAVVRRQIATASHLGMPEAEIDEHVRPWLAATGQAAYYRQIAQADQRHTDEIEPRYSELDIPVLVGWGEQDTWLPVDRGERLAAAIPGARWKLFGNSGHLVMRDAPAQVGAAVADFLRR